MALTSALNMTLNGMMTTELKTTLSSQNIANADKEGYSRKSLDTRYLTTTSGSVPISGVVIGTTDKFLVKALMDDISLHAKLSVESASLDYYNTQLGSTDGSNTLSSYLDDLYATLESLATNPDTPANKAEVVTTADNLADSLRNISGDVQSLRLDAEQKIANSIEIINATLERIDILNDKIAKNTNNDASLADYEDQRVLELQKLSEEIDIQYFYTSENRLQVYTQSGQALLLSDPHPLSYTVTNVVNSGIVYPANFSPILLDGVDLTTLVHGGKLGGLIELRDTTYVSEQAKLDEVANVLKTRINTILNTGASVPGRSLMEGSLNGLALGSAFTATGTIRVAVTDNTGQIVNFSDIALGAMATVNDVVTALNTVPGLTASLNVNGELSIAVAPTTNGVVINPLSSSVTSSSGESLTQYFGLNDLFTGTGAEDINISSYLRNQPNYLSIGVLSASGSLAIGDRGVARGDGTVANAASAALVASTSFAAAGNFSAQSNTLQRYAQAFMANVANQASLSQGEATTAYAVYKTGLELLTSKSGVNVDEETAKMLIYQNQYEAAAQVVSTIQQMLDALINAMR